jgi:tetratricopeptide (TPR) repeat protein
MNIKKLIFNTLIVLIIFVIFALAELVLRVSGFGVSYAIFTERTFNDKTYLTINKQAGQKYFTSHVQPQISTDMFLKNKPDNGYRIFVLGGSTSAGYPWEYNFSFSNILKEHVITYKPQNYVEIVNLSMPALNSYAVLDIFKQLSSHKPDLVIIYTGHNEFFGGLGAGTGGRSVILKRTYLFLRNFRLFQLYERGLASLKTLRSVKPASRSLSEDNKTLMHRLSADKAIAPDSPVRKAVQRQYRKNLRCIFRHAQKKQIDLLVMTPVSNIMNYPPFKSIGVDLPVSEYEKALKMYQGMKKDSALMLLDQILQQYPDYAACHYLKGRILYESNNKTEAFEHFGKARDLDGLPFRMPDDLKDILLSESIRYNIPIFDTGEKLGLNTFEDYSEIFCDHLHFSINGLMDLGAELAVEILKRPVNLIDKMDHFTRLDTLLGEIRLNVLLNSWPFTGNQYSQVGGFKASNDYERIVKRVWKGEISWEEGHVLAAKLLEKNNQPAKAAREYMALYHLMPYNEAPLVEAARIFSTTEQWKNVRTLSEKALSVYYDHRALLYLIRAEALDRRYGKILQLIEKYSEEIRQAEPIMRGQFYYYEAWAYANTNQLSKALIGLDKSLELIPGYQQALKLKNDIQSVFE